MNIWHAVKVSLTATAILLVSAPASVASAADKTVVLQSDLEDLQGMEANIVRFDVDAGWQTERHIHPGHVFVYVTEGTVEVDVEGEALRTIEAGEAFHELPDKPMVARTVPTDEGARFIVFQVGPRGEPLMVAHP